MSQLLWLAPHAHAVAIEDDLIILDLREDAYICLPGAGEALRACRRRLLLPAAELADDLRGAGLVTAASPAVAAPQRSAAPPTWSLVRREQGVLRRRDAPEMIGGLADAFRHYYGKPLQAMVAQAMRERVCTAPTLTAGVVAVADSLQRWAPYAPLPGKCLMRSFLLLRRLRRHGLDAVWVFGVRTWPFSAHCWLQCEDVVLDDHLDRTRGFTPILLV